MRGEPATAERSGQGRPLEPDPANTGVGTQAMHDTDKTTHANSVANAAPGIIVQGLGANLADNRPLFEGLTLEIVSGQTTCVLGPSGVGKSLLARILLGLVTPGGETLKHLVGDISTTDGHPLANRVAYMAQQDLLLPWLSVRDNVVLGYILRGNKTPEQSDKACRLLAAVGLSDVADHFPNSLSGGMRQRVALARVLAENRPIVILDEPFSQLDAITRLKLQTLAATLLSGRTVFLITHDPLEALRLGHRIVILGGRPAGVVSVRDIAGKTPRDPAAHGILEEQAAMLSALGRGVS